MTKTKDPLFIPGQQKNEDDFVPDFITVEALNDVVKIGEKKKKIDTSKQTFTVVKKTKDSETSEDGRREAPHNDAPALSHKRKTVKTLKIE